MDGALLIVGRLGAVVGPFRSLVRLCAGVMVSRGVAVTVGAFVFMLVNFEWIVG